ncbi:MAG TPA: 3-phosphoglycerate dehydrogenase family protein [Bacillota bacterium]|nr:3-phosphoglycerate dehydrogenase family protein [Bacillota bacterium]
MKNIKLYNKIASQGTDLFDKNLYNVGNDVESPDAIIVRSAKLGELEFNNELIAIARAGVGVNNIPIDRCTENGIVVFNTPGANANAVKELAIAAMLLSGRKIVEGINWVKSLNTSEVNAAEAVEKGKSQFVGPEIAGKTLGIFGLGKIGVMVANAAINMGMNVIGYDPYLTVDSALALTRAFVRVYSKEDLFAQSDYITLHATLNDETRGMINDFSIAGMKDGVRIINLARGELVNNTDICDAIKKGKVAAYVTDFASNELLDMNNDRVIIMPHLGASTPESEDNSAVMASQELIEFLSTGNIKNSVNFPTTQMAKTAANRICVLHKNIPNIIAKLTAVLSSDNINIEGMVNNSRGANAYTMFETNDPVSDKVTSDIQAAEGIYRAFAVK